MPLEFHCPACQKPLTAPHAAAGLTGSCKFCHARIVAPAFAGQGATLVAEPAPAGPVGAPSDPFTPPPPEPAGSSPYGDNPPGFTVSYNPPETATRPREPKAYTYTGTPAVADFWKRFIAFGIDFVILTFLQAGIALAFFSGRGFQTSVLLATTSEMGSAFTFVFTLFAARVLYGAICEGSAIQATPGKLVLGMKVCSENGPPISFLQALWRNFSKWATVSIVSFAPVIGYFPYAIFFYAMRDDLTQTLHDMVASTVVAERNF